MEPFKFTWKNTAKLLFACCTIAGLAMGMLYLAIAALSFVAKLTMQGHYVAALVAAVTFTLVVPAYHWLSNWTLGQFTKYNF